MPNKDKTKQAEKASSLPGKFLKPTIAQQDLKNVLRCLLSDSLTREDGGRYSLQLEQAFSQFSGSQDSFFVANESLAFYLLGKALGIQAGDELILSPLIEAEIFESLSALGMHLVFADMREWSFSLNYKSIQDCISKRSRAIILSHSFGFADEEIPILCEKIRKEFPWMIIIEDATQAMGACLKKGRSFQSVGNDADFAIFSLASSRLITAGKGAFISVRAESEGGSKPNNAGKNEKKQASLEFLRHLATPQGKGLECSPALTSRGGSRNASSILKSRNSLGLRQIKRLGQGNLRKKNNNNNNSMKANSSLAFMKCLEAFRKPFQSAWLLRQKALAVAVASSSSGEGKSSSSILAVAETAEKNTLLQLSKIARLDFLPTELEAALALSQFSMLSSFLKQSAFIYGGFMEALSSRRLAFKADPGKTSNSSYFPIWLSKARGFKGTRHAALEKFSQTLDFPFKLEDFTAYGYLQRYLDEIQPKLEMKMLKNKKKNKDKNTNTNTNTNRVAEEAEESFEAETSLYRANMQRLKQASEIHENSLILCISPSMQSSEQAAIGALLKQSF